MPLAVAVPDWILGNKPPTFHTLAIYYKFKHEQFCFSLAPKCLEFENLQMVLERTTKTSWGKKIERLSCKHWYLQMPGNLWRQSSCLFCLGKRELQFLRHLCFAAYVTAGFLWLRLFYGLNSILSGNCGRTMDMQVGMYSRYKWILPAMGSSSCSHTNIP